VVERGCPSHHKSFAVDRCDRLLQYCHNQYGDAKVPTAPKKEIDAMRQVIIQSV
jgi:hypothetical protein